MIGNNSCGVHGLLGGKVVDNVESLDLILYDGTRMTVGRTSAAQLEAHISAGGRVGRIYADLARLRDRYAGLIRDKFPRIPRRVSGYNLDELLEENGFHVARALVGSEGTCATVVSATLNLTASPPFRVLTALAFPDAFLAADAVPRVLEFGPIGLEGFDGLLLQFMRRKGLAVDDVALLPEGGGFLLVEMGAWDAQEAQAKAAALVCAAQAWPEAPAARIYNSADAARVWHVRESSLGATVFVPGEPEGFEGWDDAGIPPARLGAYLRQLVALMGEYGYRSPLYGHYGQGCVHLRINFDFRSQEGLRKFRGFIDRAADLALSFGGSLSGEHGDGQARAALLPKMFGPELIQAFQEFKAIWDPENRMNPGKLADAARVYDPVENLRHGLPPAPGQAPTGFRRPAGHETVAPASRPAVAWTSRSTLVPDQAPSHNELGSPGAGAPGPSRLGTGDTKPLETHFAFAADQGSPGAPGPSHLGTGDTKPLETHFAFAADQGSLERATERCVGVGACRKTEGGVMCPSFRATGEEQHSTRGRARLLWEMLAGALREEGFQSRAVDEALDLCLSCKACKSECPVHVDMAAYKSEFLAQRYKGRPHPLRHYLFGFADQLARLGSLSPALTNALLTGPLTSPLIKRIAGIAQQRQLPRLAAKSYQQSRKPSSICHPEQPNVCRELRPEMNSSDSKETLRAPSIPLLSVVEGSASFNAEWVGNDEPQQTLAPPQVLLWPDTWNNYYHPQTLAAAETLLTQAGFRVETPKGHICCGRPLYDFGLLGAARAYLARVLDRMAAPIEAGLPFIFLEPSCASVFKDELLELFPDDARAQRLSRQVWLLADFLAAHAPGFAAGRLEGARILLHGHCHHKAVFGGPASEIALLRQAGAAIEPIQAGCCGMAGPFGFEADKFEVSKAIANDGLLPAVEAAAPTTIIVADGFSCREQIAQLGRREAIHFAEVLARAHRE